MRLLPYRTGSSKQQTMPVSIVYHRRALPIVLCHGRFVNTTGLLVAAASPRSAAGFLRADRWEKGMSTSVTVL